MKLPQNVLKAPLALKKPAPKPAGVLLRAALVSDTHITKARYRRAVLIPALKNVARFSPDAILFAGDCTDNGNAQNWLAFAGDVEKHCGVKTKLLALGNHDTWESYHGAHDYESARDLYLAFAGRLTGERPGHVYFTREVSGYPFLFLGSESDGVSSFLSDTQLRWLEDALAAAAENRPHGPFFVVHHSPMNHTHGVGENEHGMGISGDASPRLRAILERYENVIYICGHIHFGLQKTGPLATVQRVGEHITSVCLPGFEYGELFNGKYASPGYPLPGTGLLADVYKDRIVFTGACFLLNKELPRFRWEIPLAAE